ncbi:MAG: hypothetical protein JST92_26695, partial [Deltaproteobacteria bacterium]|nr:hypothetical protein [Deltaproteobacteria bacterium]
SLSVHFSNRSGSYTVLVVNVPPTSGAPTSTVVETHSLDGYNRMWDYNGELFAGLPGVLGTRQSAGADFNDLEFIPAGSNTPQVLGAGVFDGTFSGDGQTLLFRNRLTSSGDLYEQTFIGLGELRAINLSGPGDLALLGRATFQYQWIGDQAYVGARTHSPHPHSWQDGLYGLGSWSTPGSTERRLFQ